MIKGEPILILLVDDDPAHSEAVRRALKASGMNVVIRQAGTLKEYREIAAAHQPDIAILDLSLPDGRAVEVLISPPEAGPFPIMVITSQGDELLAVEAIKAGALDYIVKSPEAFAGMPRTVERVLHEWGMLQERKRAEEALRESEERYRLLAEITQDMIYVIDRHDRVEYINAAALRALGKQSQNVIGNAYADLVPPEIAEEHRCSLQKVLESDEPFSAESHIVFPHGEMWTSMQLVPFRRERGKVTAVMGVSHDITESKRLGEILEKERHELELIIDTSPIIVFYKDKEGRFIRVNKTFAEALRMPEEDFVGKTVFDLYSPKIAQGMTDDDQTVLESGRAKLNIIEQYESADGIKWVQTDKFPIYDKNGIPVGVIGYAQDITERKRAEEALYRAEENFRCTLDDSPLGVHISTAKGETIYANRAILDIYGYDSIEELRTTSIKNRYTQESYAEFQIRHKKRQQGEEGPSEYEISIVKKNGEVRYLQVFRKKVLWNGEWQYQALYRDITERKQAEEVIRTSLREKEVLLREIHHRVKNNMQVISSLFNLQAGYIKDKEALRILKEGQTRIRSMALIHEKLYQSGDLSKIDMAGYIQSLSAHLFHVYLLDPNQVRLETEFEDVALDINTAMPCGLILNELISNALNHAFPAGRKGVLMIRLGRGKDGAVELRIADDGVGFPKRLDFRRTESLGLQIVNLLVGQLEGTIKLAGKNGTAFTVAFREMKQELGIGADRGHK